MAKTRGTGLLMLWMNVDPEREAAFNHWYDEEHMPMLLGVAGFLSGGRYRALSGAPKYLTMYELEDHNVLRSAAFIDGPRYRPAPERTVHSGGHIGRDYMIVGYRQIFPTRSQPIEATGPMPPYVMTARYDVPAAFDDEVRAWFDTGFGPAALATPGVLAVRRYAAVEARPAYLTVASLERPDVVQADAWREAERRQPWSARVQRCLEPDAGSPGLYERIYPR